ncbi:MAG: hypothetical protein KGH63_04415 [Candidatus Micrarchaeota archaeon]|nr:hypothetical protein [Candidatus Micrarchaeota archaeon]
MPPPVSGDKPLDLQMGRRSRSIREQMPLAEPAEHKMRNSRWMDRPGNAAPEPAVLARDYYSLKEAFEELRAHEKGMEWRAFAGRVERGSIPSAKSDGQLWVPKETIASMIEWRRGYCTLA